MRLTLRTLLAYIDDTLEAGEIKEIGQKVAESAAAQELIARIKQITRRRRLTTPPATGPNAKFDANTVAEYLDNVLPSEQLAEVEKTCLESDVHLAEIASCHQILTLVLGEPALVPPTARERMYALVRGKEAIPSRKASVLTPAGATGDGGEGVEESGLLSMPFYRRQTGLVRWALPLAGVALIALLAVAIWQALPAKPERVARGNDKEKESGVPVAPATSKPAGGDEVVHKPDADTGKPTPPKQEPEKVPEETKPPVVVKEEPTTPVQPTVPDLSRPSTVHREAGFYNVMAGVGPSVLVHRMLPKDGEADREAVSWERYASGAPVFTNERLVSLPGYLSEVRLTSGVHLQLRGNVREFSLNAAMEALMESSVVIHGTQGLDLEFTLNCGRVFFSNAKKQGPASVRVRFADEIWDVTLKEPGTEIGMDLLRQFSQDVQWQKGEEPEALLLLWVVSGKAGLKVNKYGEYPNLEAPPGPAYVRWDNKGRGVQPPMRLEKLSAGWSKNPPATEPARAMTLALEQQSKALAANRPLEVVLMEEVQSKQIAERLLAIYSLSALDEVGKLLDVLGDDKTGQFERDAADFALRRWISRDVDNGRRMFDPKERSGLLTEKGKFRRAEAEIIVRLLHYYDAAECRNPDTFRVLADYLTSDKLAIRELAYWHLAQLSAGVKLPPFNPTLPPEECARFAAAVNKLIDAGELPPAARKTPKPGT
jgi:hypothetical protein